MNNKVDIEDKVELLVEVDNRIEKDNTVSFEAVEIAETFDLWDW